MTRAVVSVILLAMVALVGVYGLQASLAEAGEDRVVQNETWTPDAGNWTVLDESNRDGAYYGNAPTVYDENGTVMDRGSDFAWNDTDGTVKALVGGDLEGDASANITYEYQQTTPRQRNLAELAAIMPEIVGIIIVVFVFILAMMFIGGG